MNEFSKLFKSIGYEFKSFSLVKRALTHSSIGNSEKNYEKLEFLGDRVLGLVISSNIFFNFKNDSEGELAKKYSLLVSKATLKKISDEINLIQFIKISKELRNSSLESIKANSLEALIGAIYLDSSFENTENVVKKLWQNHINQIDLTKYDPKSRLQEWCLKNNNKLPLYYFVKKEGPEHEPKFTISVKHGSQLNAQGIGKNKQEAEKNAASKLLKEIEKRKL